MEKKYSNEMPQKAREVKNGFVLSYQIQETPMDEIENLWKLRPTNGETSPSESFKNEHKYMYNVVRVPMGRWNYNGIVEVIIRDKYTADEMEAITNNMAAINAVFMQTLVKSGIVEATRFLRESADAVDAETFREMQEWRAMAKKEAKGIFG